MPELALWLKNADTNSVYDQLSATEAKTLTHYLHGKLTPIEAATRFVENFDMEPVCNPSFYIRPPALSSCHSLRCFGFTRANQNCQPPGSYTESSLRYEEGLAFQA